MYKMIKGERFKLAEQRNILGSIRGRVFYVCLNGKKIKPVNKQALSINAAAARRQDKSIHKELWKVLFNEPKAVLIYDKTINDTLIGIVKYCVTHGIIVGVDAGDFKELYTSVCNFNDSVLFKRYQVEVLKIEDIPDDLKPELNRKKVLLEETRAQFKSVFWESVEEHINSLTEAYNVQKLYDSYEAAIRSDRWRTQELLLNSKHTCFVYNGYIPRYYSSTVDSYREELEKKVLKWAPAFDIPVITERDSNYNTYPFREEIPVSKWSPLDYVTDLQYNRRCLKIKTSLKGMQLNELVSLGQQIEFYKSQEDWQSYLSDKYSICTACGDPVYEGHEDCKTCGESNPHFVDVSYYGLSITSEK